MNKYTVRAEVKSDKFGQGVLVAELNHENFMKYANLSDAEKLAFLKEHQAKFVFSAQDLTEEDLNHYQVSESQATKAMVEQAKGQEAVTVDTKPVVKTSRKMRMNINGQDTGWVDVNEENEAQYNQMIEDFNKMHQEMSERFNRIFGQRFGHLLNFDHSLFLEHKK